MSKSFPNLNELWERTYEAEPPTQWAFDGGFWKVSPDGEALMLYLQKTAESEPSEMYEIELSRCQTVAGLLDAVVQLHNKTWIAEDNLSAFLRAVAYVVVNQQRTMVSFAEPLPGKINRMLANTR